MRERERERLPAFNFKIKYKINYLIKKIFFKFNLILNKYQDNTKKLVDQFLTKIKIIDSGHKLIRIGADSDGGYLIPDILDQIEYCFSPGVGNMSSFEDHLSRFKIYSFLADGTVNYNGKHNFIKKNLNSFNDENNITLETWVNDKIKDKSNDKLLLQMDIEGSEIEVLYNSDINFLERFKCIIIEFHHFDKIIDSLGLKIYSDIFDKILKTHYICHIHPNNYGGSTFINGNEIPNVLEITFVNKKIAKCAKKIEYNLPHKFDRDCDQNIKPLECPKLFYK